MQLLMAAGYHERVLDRALDYARSFLAQNEERLLEGVAQRRRRWIPRTINREIARAMLHAASELIEDLRQPDGAARESLLATINEFAASLAAAPALAASRSKLLKRPEIQSWISDAWDKVRDMLLGDLKATPSRTRRALAIAIGSVGEALTADVEMRERLDTLIETIAVEALPWRAELIRFVTKWCVNGNPGAFRTESRPQLVRICNFIRN